IRTVGEPSTVDSIWIHGDPTQKLEINLPDTPRGTWHIGGSRSTGHWGLLFPRTENSISDETLSGGPAPGFETRILDPDGVELPPGLPGQLVLRQLGDILPFNTPWRALWTHQGSLHITERQDGLVWAQARWLDILKLQSAIQALPFVQDAHVEALATALGDTQLITWVAYRDGHEATSTTLREAVANRFSDQSLGGIIWPVDEIPRDDHGDVRTRLLPNPNKNNAAAFEPPQSDMEKILASIWENLLDAERVGAHDSFAELGGTSLQALRVVEEVEELTSWSFSPRLLFFQTLRQIADRASQGGQLS
ncbi:phosphopantetheine-binding protein, partial [Myxococcota bacterium]|nr:phosphopantetheine-binding protein [Myxococcota bacterium]